jgi:hypothetical protein
MAAVGLARLGLAGAKKAASSKMGKKAIKKVKSTAKKATTAVKKKVKALNKKLSPKKTAADRKVSKLTGKDARNRNLNVGLASAAKTAGVAKLVSMKDAANKAKKGSGFGKAFASARSKYLKGKGGKTFDFEGKKYTVKTKEDVAKERKMASAAKRSGAKVRAASGGYMKQMAVGGVVKKSASMLKKMLEAKKARKAGVAKMKPKKTMMGGGYMKKMSYGGKVKK